MKNPFIILTAHGTEQHIRVNVLQLQTYFALFDEDTTLYKMTAIDFGAEGIINVKESPLDIDRMIEKCFE